MLFKLSEVLLVFRMDFGFDVAARFGCLFGMRSELESVETFNSVSGDKALLLI